MDVLVPAEARLDRALADGGRAAGRRRSAAPGGRAGQLGDGRPGGALERVEDGRLGDPVAALEVGRLGVQRGDRRQRVGEVVEDKDEVGLDERRPAGTPTGSEAGRGTVGSNVLHGVVGERPDRPAHEPGHALLRRDPAARGERPERGEGVGRREGLGRQARVVLGDAVRPGLDRGAAVADRQQAARPRPEERVPPEAFAALHGLQEVGRPAVVEAEEGADRRLEVGRAGRAQEDRVGGARQALRLPQAERIGCRHVRGLRADRRSRESNDLSSPGRKVEPSAVPPSFGDAALRDRRATLVADRRCPLSLALCAGAYWRPWPLPRRVRSGGSRVHSPPPSPRFPPATGSLCRRHDGYSSRSQPVIRDVAGTSTPAPSRGVNRRRPRARVEDDRRNRRVATKRASRRWYRSLPRPSHGSASRAGSELRNAPPKAIGSPRPQPMLPRSSSPRRSRRRSWRPCRPRWRAPRGAGFGLGGGPDAG